MTSTAEWSRAYARQARADFSAFLYLQSHPESGLPNCQFMHFLQMACEKLCKAHLCDSGSDPKDLQSSHAYIAKTLPVIVRGELEDRGKRKTTVRAIGRFANQLSREIELLAPSVDDDGRRPENCEYPWLDGREIVRVPVDWTFFAEDLLAKPHARVVIKMISFAINRLV